MERSEIRGGGAADTSFPIYSWLRFAKLALAKNGRHHPWLFFDPTRLRSSRDGNLAARDSHAIARTRKLARQKSAAARERSAMTDAETVSLDYVVGACDQRRRHCEAERLGGFEMTASSYLVGACTGRSAGFSPMRMR